MTWRVCHYTAVAQGPAFAAWQAVRMISRLERGGTLLQRDGFSSEANRQEMRNGTDVHAMHSRVKPVVQAYMSRQIPNHKRAQLVQRNRNTPPHSGRGRGRSNVARRLAAQTITDQAYNFPRLYHTSERPYYGMAWPSTVRLPR